MYKFKLLRTAECEQAHLQEDDTGLLHGTIVLKEQVKSLFCSGKIVLADSHFSFVPSCVELKRNG